MALIRMACAAIALIAGTALTASFAAESRMAPVSTATGFWTEELASGLKYPAAMAFLPDGDFLIIERMGVLQRLDRTGRLTPITRGLPPAFAYYQADGYRDLALDPDFARNRRIYILLSEGNPAGRRVAIYRARLDRDGLDEVQRIFITTDNESTARISSMVGRMRFLADKTLLFGTSAPEERAADIRLKAQDPASHLGKLLRINRDGSIPADNPFLKVQGAVPELLSLIHI